MKNQDEMLETVTYEAPQVKTIEVHVEKGFAISDPDNPTGSGENMPWG